VDDDGFCHVRGEYGNLDRAAFEYTKAEVVALRSILRVRGAKTAFGRGRGLARRGARGCRWLVYCDGEHIGGTDGA
jgi:hypothetical protein